MRGQLRITEMYAYVVIDDDGTEGVPAFPGRDGMVMPMVGADTTRAAMLRPIAQRMASQLQKPVTLLRFTVREEIEVIQP